MNVLSEVDNAYAVEDAIVGHSISQAGVLRGCTVLPLKGLLYFARQQSAFERLRVTY